MLSAVVDYKETEQWQNERFIPHASTWLNGERWEDESVQFLKTIQMMIMNG